MVLSEPGYHPHKEFLMPTFCIKHVLPDGTVAGYHGDSCCSITSNKKYAKTIVKPTEADVADWLKTVRQNFEYTWTEDETAAEYRGSACWKGYALDQIRTEVELVSEEDDKRPLIGTIVNFDNDGKLVMGPSFTL